MKARLLRLLPAVSFCLILISGCAGQYEGYYGASYYEPAGGYYGYWGPGYYVAPYHHEYFEREQHGREFQHGRPERTYRPSYRPAPANRPIPSIPSGRPFIRLH